MDTSTIIKCAFCKRETVRGIAVEDGWEPYFWYREIVIAQECCVDCGRKELIKYDEKIGECVAMDAPPRDVWKLSFDHPSEADVFYYFDKPSNDEIAYLQSHRPNTIMTLTEERTR